MRGAGMLAVRMRRAVAIRCACCEDHTTFAAYALEPRASCSCGVAISQADVMAPDGPVLGRGKDQDGARPLLNTCASPTGPVGRAR